MPQPDTSSTFKNNSLGSVQGAPASEVTVEFLAADPTLVAGEYRIWVNTTSHTLKFTDDGATTYTVTST